MPLRRTAPKQLPDSNARALAQRLNAPTPSRSDQMPRSARIAAALAVVVLVRLQSAQAGPGTHPIPPFPFLGRSLPPCPGHHQLAHLCERLTCQRRCKGGASARVARCNGKSRSDGSRALRTARPTPPMTELHPFDILGFFRVVARPCRGQRGRDRSVWKAIVIAASMVVTTPLLRIREHQHTRARAAPRAPARRQSHPPRTCSRAALVVRQ
jgi:hypothetical protein